MVAGTFLPPRIGVCRNKVKAFIQNVHHFRDDTLRDPAPPDDHVVVFDEAQRAWDARQLASFMKRKKRRPGFTQSESELLLSALDRHDDWAVVVCLVGGGQEINTGEAGIEKVARERPHGVPRLGRLHFAASDRRRVCGHRRPRSAHGIASENGASHRNGRENGACHHFPV